MKDVKLERVKVSSKYQVVIPKNLRNKLDIKPGDYIKMEVVNNKLVAQKSSISKLLDTYYGSMKGAWGPDPASYVRKMRDAEWD